MTLNYGKCSIWPRHLGKTNGIHFELILVRCFFWQTEAVLGKDFNKNTPIWLNPTVSGLSNRQRFKGTSTIADFLGTMNVILPFLTITILLLRFKKIHVEEAPRNSSLNVLLNLSDKGVSKLFSLMKDSFSHVLDIAVTKWGENTDLDFGSFCLSRSFQKHHLTYKDTYSKYIQLRMLHHRFYTNEKLFKIGIKKSDLCSFCITNVDSAEHITMRQFKRSVE